MGHLPIVVDSFRVGRRTHVIQTAPRSPALRGPALRGKSTPTPQAPWTFLSPRTSLSLACPVPWTMRACRNVLRRLQLLDSAPSIKCS